jgi:hypothetical protein
MSISREDCDLTLIAFSFHELWQAAYEVYLDLAQQYKADEARMTGSADAKWALLRMHALSRALDCHVKLALPLSRTYSVLALEFLKVYAECVDTSTFQPASHVSLAERKTVEEIVQSWEAPSHDANPTGESQRPRILKCRH